MAARNIAVSPAGSVRLPRELLERWGMGQGGEVGCIDLGDAVLVVPHGISAAHQELRRTLTTHYDHGVRSLGDSELDDQTSDQPR